MLFGIQDVPVSLPVKLPNGKRQQPFTLRLSFVVKRKA